MPLLVQSLLCEEEDLQLSTMTGLQDLIQDAPDVITSYLDSIVPQMVKLAKHKPKMVSLHLIVPQMVKLARYKPQMVSLHPIVPQMVKLAKHKPRMVSLHPIVPQMVKLAKI